MTVSLSTAYVMSILIAQAYYGYIPPQYFLSFLLLLLHLVIGLVGTVWIVVRRASRRSTTPVARSLVLWWVGLVGTLYTTVFAVLLIFHDWSSTRPANPTTEELCWGIGFLIASLSHLPAAIIERRKMGWGACYLAAIASIVGFVLSVQNPATSGAFSSYTYSSIMYGFVLGLLIPLWVSSFSIAATVISWQKVRFSLRSLIMVVAGVALVVGTTGVVIRNANRVVNTLRAEVAQRNQAQQAMVDKANNALASFVHAAARQDVLKLEQARNEFQESLQAFDAEPAVLQAFYSTTSDQARIRLLQLLSSRSMWKSGQYVQPTAVAQALEIVRDKSQTLQVRRAAVQVLLNWGKWDLLAQALPPLADRAHLGPAVTEFIISESDDPDLSINFRLSPNGSERLVRILPALTEKPGDCVPALVKLLEMPVPWSDTVSAAAQTLGSLGTDARGALPQLRAAALSNYRSLSMAAKNAIDQIERPARQSGQ